MGKEKKNAEAIGARTGGNQGKTGRHRSEASSKRTNKRLVEKAGKSGEKKRRERGKATHQLLKDSFKRGGEAGKADH